MSVSKNRVNSNISFYTCIFIIIVCYQQNVIFKSNFILGFQRSPYSFNLKTKKENLKRADDFFPFK